MRTHLIPIKDVACATLMAISLIGCSGGDSTQPEPPDESVAIVLITPRGLTLPVGGRGQLSAAVRDASGADVGGTVAWTSRDQVVASTSSSGEVSGNRVGLTQVIATVQGKSDTVSVAVIDNITLVVSPPVATVNVGGTTQFTVTAFDGAGNPVAAPPVTWTSSVPARATISGTGLARGVTAGTTNIIASAGQRSSQPALLTVRDTSSAGPCDGIAAHDRFEATIEYGFKAPGLRTDGGFTFHADDNGRLTAMMTRFQDGPFIAGWSGPISGNASITQRVVGTGTTTLNGGGPIIALPPAGLPQMAFIVNLTTCTYQLRAAAVIHTRLVPEVGSPNEGPEMVAQIQFVGQTGAWRSLGIFEPNDALPAQSLLWGGLHPDRDVVMPLGLSGSLFAGTDQPAGQGTGGFQLFRR